MNDRFPFVCFRGLIPTIIIRISHYDIGICKSLLLAKLGSPRTFNLLKPDKPMTGLRESGFELPEVNQIEVRFQDVFEDMDLYCMMKHRYMVFIYYLFVCTYMYMMYNIIFMYIKCVCKLCCFGERLRLYGKNYWEPFSPLRCTAGDNCQKWRPTMWSMATWRRQKP